TTDSEGVSDTTTDSEGVSDKSTGTVQLSSSQFAVVEKSHKCTLVPWRPVINRQLSSEVCAADRTGAPTRWEG
ncbi:DUF3363 domain-containing protein, partial [Pseudomonas aeruginosa]|uniref:DUF3363 domain-containing protein n=1 Tax=Pseudomonas aeruginosa TaxID=287 RepID=UPI0019D44F79|nr:DUF3363 domain-containing protein [Pseudomonas aeruginosa]